MMSMPLAAPDTFQTEALEAVRLAWPAILALAGTAELPALVVLAEPWRVVGSALDGPAGASGLVLQLATRDAFLALPAGPGADAWAKLDSAVEQAGPQGIVVAYLAGAVALVPCPWTPKHEARAVGPRFGLRSAGRIS